jgi:hypothetical protein
MPANRHRRRRSTVWGAVCILLLSLPGQAQPLATVVKPNLSLPTLAEDATRQDASPMVCREPQKQSDSRLLGPRVCRTQKQWDDLHAQGLDITADGKGVAASEKYRSLNPAVALPH